MIKFYITKHHLVIEKTVLSSFISTGYQCGATTLSIMTFSLTPLIITIKNATLSIIILYTVDVAMVSVVSEPIMLRVMLSVIMLSVIMLSGSG